MKTLSRLIPLIGLVLFVWIVYRTGLPAIIGVIQTMDWSAVLLCPVFILLTIPLKAYKWQLVLRASGIKYPFRSCARVWCIGFFAGLVTPAKLGDAVRAYYVKRDTGRTASEGLSTVFIDRVFDMFALLSFAALSIVVLLFWLHLHLAWGALLVGGAALGVALVLSTNERLVRTILRPFFYLFVPKRLQDSFRKVFERFYASVTQAKQRKQLLLLSFSVGLLSWLIFILYEYVVSQSLHLPFTIPHLFVMIPLISLIELLPISVSGLGTREAALIGFFTLFNANPTAVVPFSLAYLVLGGWMLGVPGLVLWLRDPVKFREVKKL